MTSGSRTSRSPVVEMVDYEDWGSARISHLEQQDLEWYHRDRTKSMSGEEIPTSQAEINEELLRFQAELKSEMARAKMKLDVLIAMLMDNRKSKAEDQQQTTPSDGIFFTPPSSAEAENEVLFKQDECEIELPMVSMDLDLDSTFGNVPSIIEQQVEESNCFIFGKLIVQTSACNVFDEMSKPNPSDFQLEKDYYDTTVIRNVELNEIQEVFVEMPGPVTSVQQSFYMEYLVPNKPENQFSEEEQQHLWMKMGRLKIVPNLLDEMTPSFRAEVMNEQLMDIYIRDINFYYVTLFDPGGYKKCAMISTGGVVPELFGKAHGTYDIGMEGVDWGKIILKNDTYSVLEVPHQNSLTLSKTFCVVNAANEGYSSILDTKQLQASETVTEGDKVLGGTCVTACTPVIFIFPKAENHMLEKECDWQNDVPKLLKKITSPSPTGLQPHSTLFSSIEGYYTDCTLRNAGNCALGACKMLINELGEFHSSQNKGSGIGHHFFDEMLGSFPMKLDIVYRHLRLSVVASNMGMISMFILDPGTGTIVDQWNAHGGHVNVKCNCILTILVDSKIMEDALVHPKDAVLAGLHIQMAHSELAGRVLVALTYTEHIVYTLLSRNSSGYQNAVVQRVTHSSFQLLDGFKPSQSGAKRSLGDTEHLNFGLMNKIGVPIASSVDHFSEIFGSITNIGFGISRPTNFKLGLLLNDSEPLTQYMIANDDVAIATLEGFVWDPGQDIVSFYILRKGHLVEASAHGPAFISFYIIEDNDVLKRKGIKIQLALALKQDFILNEASAHYYAHTGILACSLVEWEILLLWITSSKFRIRKSYNLKELVTFRSVGLDYEVIIDAMRFNRFGADSELNIFVQKNTSNRQTIKPSLQFGLAFSTLGLERYIWDPGSSATLIGGLVLMHSATYVLGRESLVANGKYFDTISILMESSLLSVACYASKDNIWACEKF